MSIVITDTNGPVPTGTPLEVELRAISIGGYAGGEELTLAVGEASTTATVSVTREGRTSTTLTVPTDDIEPGEYTTTVSGTDSTAQTTVTLTNDSPSISTYANDAGIVDTDGLLHAIADWREDTIETDLLEDVIEAWRNGTPIN